MSAEQKNAASLEAENARLRARIQELERLLCSPALKRGSATGGASGVRQLLAGRYEVGDDPRRRAWAGVQELAIGWAFEYARERHPKFRFERAYAWEGVPMGGV